jgi:SM-20-related protein
MTSKMIAMQLGKSGLCICPNFLSPKSLLSVAHDFHRIRNAKEFRRAETGHGPIDPHQARVRTDSTYWLDRETQSPAQNLLWRKLDILKSALNRSLFLGLTNFEGHYSVYSEGGYYQRHKDCFQGDSSRVVSFVLYLNRNWKPADGGALRVYSTDPATDRDGVESYTDINPVGGTMACFMSGESQHEVLLNHRERFSLSGWFK